MGRIISFGVGGYRSFGNDVAHFPRVSKINLIAGSNNSGKSNVLRFVHEHYATAVNGTKAGRTKWGFGNLDAHQGTAPFHFALGLPLGSEGHDAIKEHEGVRRALRRRTEEVIDTLLDCQCLTDGGDVAWFRFSSPRLGDDLQAVVPKDFESCIDSNIWLRLAQALTGQRTDSPTNAARDVFKILAPNKDASVNVALVPAIRQVTAGETADFSGSGIIDRLARLQNPGVQEQNHRKQFGKINGFLQWVLADDNATIEIPYERDTILVHHGGRTLPLSHLGTGVHEVVILAAASTVLQDQVLCIEEPELHLHPVLQRKLLQYLAEETDNQYFISTHSAHLLDEQRASIYHIRHAEGRSLVDVAVTPQERFTICWELGYRASDLLQTNCVIWVEGPSDRLYIRHWMQAVDDSLTEGLHYSIMFYGGRLLRHLSANDPEVEEFISLRRLNRNVCVVMDSDIRSPGGHVNATKQRVRMELEGVGGSAWITQGKEIENYLSRGVLIGAIERSYSDFESLVSTNRYHNALRYRSTSGSVKDRVDKVKVASTVASVPADLAVLDLGQRINGLVSFVRNAND